MYRSYPVPRTIHTSAHKSMKALVREVLTHVIGRISARGGALALSMAGAAALIGKGTAVAVSA